MIKQLKDNLVSIAALVGGFSCNWWWFRQVW